uniref:Uncharacterized protein n=1 Tax=Oryza glumipatula TaxID=40148 RepID=A0A0E0B620_9ORYZ
MELKNAFSTSTEAFLLRAHRRPSCRGTAVAPQTACHLRCIRCSSPCLPPLLSILQLLVVPSLAEAGNLYLSCSALFVDEVMHMAYSISAASQGSMILPSLMKPNSSWDILRSSMKTLMPRYTNGTSNRLPSAVYMTQWPLTATEVEHSSNRVQLQEKTYGSSSGSYKQEICWLTPPVGTIRLVQWQDIGIELSNAFTTSTEGFLLSKHMAYSISAASKGNTILPSLVKPNSSWDILRSSLKTAVPRYVNGTSNRLPSAVYMTQWPLTATEVEHSLVSWAFAMILFLPRAAILATSLPIEPISWR